MTELVRYEAARKALAEAKSIDEVKSLRDKAEAMRAYARQAKDLDMANMAAEIRIRAERRLGEMLLAQKEGEMLNKGGRPKLEENQSTDGTSFPAPTLSDMGITKNMSSRTQELANIPEDEFEAVIANVKDGNKELTGQTVRNMVKEKKREDKRQENREIVRTVVEPSGSYTTIVIDPPWSWADEGDINQLGRAKPDYHTLTIDELTALPVSDLAEDNAHLYLWITNRSLPKGFRLLEAWGFRYITAITWVKPSFGMGNYFRGQTEHILFGVKGSLPLLRSDQGTVFTAKRGQKGHSSKPAEFYELVESCSPGPYLEMFSRNERQGWIHWGENDSAA